jgi:hypothetical protein
VLNSGCLGGRRAEGGGVPGEKDKRKRVAYHQHLFELGYRDARNDLVAWLPLPR